MKVLQIIRSVDPQGGGPIEGIRQITPHLLKLGVYSSYASLDPPESSFLKDEKTPVHYLGPVNNAYGYRRGLPSQIRELANDHDAVLIHGIWQYHAFATWRALHATDIPYYVYPHGMLDPWFKKTYPLKHLKKWAYWPWADYRVLRDAKAVLFTTDQERLLARKSFWLYRVREEVVGYGTSAPPEDKTGQMEAFLHRFPELSGQRILLFLSRIHPKKGVDLLIEAFAAVASHDSRLQLVIAGPDQVGWKATLQKRAAKLGIADRITWPGMLSGELKWGAFRSAELFCLPSHQENFGIVVAEALSCGLPVAIAEPVNIAAEVADAGAGLMHADTAAGTTAALEHWLQLPDAERVAMGARASRMFQERFDYATLASQLLPVLRSC
jgi:glycosyltransferase involved in cell wall biosynthesis